jgi:hypothetical protein
MDLVLVFVFVAPFAAHWSAKNVPWIILPTYVVMVPFALYKRRLRISRYAIAAGIAFHLSLFSPIDIAFRRAARMSIRVVDVHYSNTSREDIRMAMAKGDRENVDFIEYFGTPLLNPARHAILLTVPFNE